MGGCLSSSVLPVDGRALDRNESAQLAETKFKPVSTPVVVTAIPLDDLPPMSPAEDRHGRFEWVQSSFVGTGIVRLQMEGFVVGASVANNYVFLRRPRLDLSTHRFATVTSVTVGDCVLSLGACRMGGRHITRDVCDGIGASITMNVIEDGREIFILNGGTVKVSFAAAK